MDKNVLNLVKGVNLQIKTVQRTPNMINLKKTVNKCMQSSY